MGSSDGFVRWVHQIDSLDGMGSSDGFFMDASDGFVIWVLHMGS